MSLQNRKQPTERHPLYGEIPLVEKHAVGRDGRDCSWFEYDPSFQPKLPSGAVRGDPSQQEYCTAHHVPKYFYVNEHRTCVQCGEDFVFRAEEQKFWYETLKFNFGSVAIRCPSCRRKRRTEASLRQQIATVLEQLKTKPRDPHLLLELGRATVTYRERTGQGNLDRAISACRKARDEWPTSSEPLFWEGRCHQLARRVKKARWLYETFLEEAHGEKHLAKIVGAAERELQALRSR